MTGHVAKPIEAAKLFQELELRLDEADQDAARHAAASTG
jgi:hypothetical protein